MKNSLKRIIHVLVNWFTSGRIIPRLFKSLFYSVYLLFFLRFVIDATIKYSYNKSHINAGNKFFIGKNKADLLSMSVSSISCCCVCFHKFIDNLNWFKSSFQILYRFTNFVRQNNWDDQSSCHPTMSITLYYHGFPSRRDLLPHALHFYQIILFLCIQVNLIGRKTVMMRRLTGLVWTT